MDPRLLDILTQQQASGFAGLSGSQIRGTIRLAEAVVNQAIAATLPPGGPFRSVEVRPQSGDRLVVRLALAKPSFLPSITATLAIDHQPRLPDDPVLTLQAVGGIGSLMRLAAPMIGSAVALPPGVRLEGDRLTVDLRGVLQAHGQGALLDFAEDLRIRTEDGALVVTFSARIPTVR